MMANGFNPAQGLVDYMNAEGKRRRAKSQMTLGKLIDLLKSIPGDRAISGLGGVKSYRGYYEDLAFEPDDEPTSVGDALAICRRAMGREFTGYKGGDYLMGEHTPLWVSPYGDASGVKLMGLDTESDPIRPITEEEEW